MRLVSDTEIVAAQAAMAAMPGAIRPVRTPLVPAPDADPTRPLLLKPENLQPTGAFKIRGALHAASAVPETARSRGLVAYSSGNHARAVAYAARAFGMPATVVVPHTAPAAKVAAARALGAEIVPVEVAERERRAHRIADERGATVVPPFDDPAVIAGQGTVGLEIAEDLNGSTGGLPTGHGTAAGGFGWGDELVVLVPVSGGGLISGVGVAVKSVLPKATVIGVEPELAADAQDSLRSGTRRHWPVASRTRTAADGLTAEPSERTFAHMREVVDDIVTVSEEDIAEATGYLARTCHLVAERSGAVTTAAYRHRGALLPETNTVAVVSGGNIDTEELATLLASRDR
ncbi:threonine dehydratase [Halopolyspora algeriensis]|uniref:threonine ammonia-lyase n=1 Tax=Halopolyspora algeriensis TaxID=1500506 RepID=A0A368VP98_9ACTN|nr:threonine/serine dehydratase [Halopolyspora algeriensis]RCW43549.1 threonine dehydratase [Halopolyspora algeriensis]TQM46418.1 threonine dehydratase [Halopolyspora algeriensis]TQM47666.1 threonine dehydratase [Halopolyspora algeriensis]